ncbi:MAG: hypothetical protein AAF840_14410, partial [Bacteroidota bacterium]
MATTQEGWLANIDCVPLDDCLTEISFDRSFTAFDSVYFEWTNDGDPTITTWDVYFGGLNEVPDATTTPTLDNIAQTSVFWKGVTPGTAYWSWVRADCDDNNSIAGRWRIMGFFNVPEGPPINDTCDEAIDITANINQGAFAAGSNLNATVGTVAPPFIGCNTFNSWCDDGAQRDVWFQFTIPTGNEPLGALVVGTQGSSFDTQLAIWDDCQGTLISANDDFFGANRGFTSLTTAAVIPGNTYFIQVDGYNGASGNVSLDISYSPILGPADHDAGTVTAFFECTGADGWTHYVNDFNHTIIASVKKQGNDLGWLPMSPGFSAVQEATGGVVNLGIAAAAGSECADVATPYVFNDDWWVMQRTWDITPAVQPVTPVLVRSYYTTEDFNAVATELPGVITQHTDLTHYKITGADESLITNPCHETIEPGNYQEFDSGQYVYGTFGDGHYAEFEITSFSGGGGGGGTGATGAFPVGLTDFWGERVGKVNRLAWETEYEENSDIFIIERTAAGPTTWGAVGEVKAAGHSQRSLAYTWEDHDAPTVAFYRLRLTDLDGSFEYSPIISIVRQEGERLQVIPNPAAENQMVQIQGAAAGA